MSYGKIKALTILAVPLLLTLSFLIATAALAEAASPGPAAESLNLPGRAIMVSGAGLEPGGFEATSAATGSLTITDVTVADVGATSAVITWTTDEASSSVVRYDTSQDSLTLSATSPVTGTDHAVGLAGLTPGAEYFFQVESTDDEGDTAVDDNQGELYSFTTQEAETARRAFVGTVAGEPAETVALVLEGTQGEVTIILPEDFTLKTPGGPRAGKFEDGASVVILAQRADDDWVALRVLVKPVKPNLPVVGVVTGIGPTSFTVLDPRGKAHLLRVEAQTSELVAGEVVTVFKDNSNRARGLVRAEEVRSRMQQQLENIAEAEDGENPQEEWGNRGRSADALIRGLETHGTQQLKVFERALHQAPDDVKEKISEARVRAQKGIDNARSAVGRAKGKLKQQESNNRDDAPEGNNGPGKSNGDQGNDAGNSGDSPGNSGGQGKGKEKSEENSGDRGNSERQAPGDGGGNDAAPGNPGDQGNPGGPGPGVDGGGNDGAPGNSGNRGKSGGQRDVGGPPPEDNDDSGKKGGNPGKGKGQGSP